MNTDDPEKYIPLMQKYNYVCDDFEKETDIDKWITSNDVASVRYREKERTDTILTSAAVAANFGYACSIAGPEASAAIFVLSFLGSLACAPPNTYVQCDLIVTTKAGKEYEYTYDTIGNPDSSGVYRSSEAIVSCGWDGTVNGVQTKPYSSGIPAPRVYDYDNIEFYIHPETMKYQP